MAQVTIEDNVNRTEEVVDAIRDLTGEGVRAGVLGESGSVQQMKASVHEFGARIKITEAMENFFFAKWKETGNEGWRALFLAVQGGKEEIVIPERRFLRSALDNNEEFIRDRFRGRVLNIVDGSGTPDEAVTGLGEDMVTLIRQQMGENGPDLSGVTLALRRGGSEATPLRDTGRLSQSIAWETI